MWSEVNASEHGTARSNRVYRREEVLSVQSDMGDEIPTILNVSKHIQTC